MSGKSFSRIAKFLSGSLVFFLLLSSPLSSPPAVRAQDPVTNFIFLPLVLNNWPPVPATPTLNAINNSDQNDTYPLSWSAGAFTDTYLVQEATLADFSDAVTAYAGPSTSWSATAKTPATYYYRVKGANSYNQGAWSNTQSVIIYPLYVGLKVRWDGTGTLYVDDYYNIGYHETVQFDALTDVDTVSAYWYEWYDPDPFGSGSYGGYAYYSPTTGQCKSCSTTPDPYWKWIDPWRLDYNAQYTNGQTVLIGGQKFTVTGPLDGNTAFGKPIRYWQFVNQAKFLFYDDGSGLTQYVHAKDIILRYDAGGSRLLIYSNILRRYYYDNKITTATIQYITHLTSATSIPGSPPFTLSIQEQTLPTGETIGNGTGNEVNAPERKDLARH